MTRPDPSGGPRPPTAQVQSADALVASAATRAALDEASRAPGPAAPAAGTMRRWEDDGGTCADALWPIAEAPAPGDALRRADGVRRRADDAVAAVVRAYARDLRKAGVPLPAILRAIGVAVRGMPAGGSATDRAEAFIRDAERTGLEAYYGP
jgi:hypothetical protein